MSAADRRRVDGRAAGVLAVLVLGPPAALAVWSGNVADELPAELARHWTGARVTGTWTRTTGLVAGPLMSAAALPLAAAAVAPRIASATRRVLAGTAAWVATFVTALGVSILAGHIGVADPMLVPPPTTGAAVGTVLGLASAAAAALAVRAPAGDVRPATAPPGADAPRLPADTAPAPWSGRPRISRGVIVATAGAVALVAALAPLAGWWLLVLAGVVGALAVGTLHARATVDERGLEVRASVGLRLLRVPLEQVAAADVTDLDPWAFGGWGYRVDPHGRVAIVTRSGEALRVRKASGVEVLVTVDDAAAAAATLNSYADRHHDG